MSGVRCRVSGVRSHEAKIKNQKSRIRNRKSKIKNQKSTIKCFLGVDGGGTKTRCALGDETRVLATSIGGASNIVRVGVAQARESLHSAIRSVCEMAKVGPDEIDYTCIGASGAGREDIAAQIRGILGELTPATVEVVGDTVIALEAAFGSGPGAIAISGTGSIVYGRNSRGETARAGGWGYAISDEGSAQWIGRRAVWTILRACDQGAKTQLSELVLKAWNLDTLDELVQKANAVPPPEFPELFRLVLRAASDGDAMAAALLADAGAHLAEQAVIVIRRLFPEEPCSGDKSSLDTQLAASLDRQSKINNQKSKINNQKSPLAGHARVAMTGSVFRQSEIVRQVFYNSLQAKFSGIEIRSDLVDPVDGALARARRHHLAIST